MKRQHEPAIFRETGQSIVGIFVLLLTMGVGTVWWLWQTKISPHTEQNISSVVLPSINLKPQAYWLQAEGDQTRLVPQQIAVKPGNSPELALKEALNNLINRHQASNLTTTIPPGTRLLSLRVAQSGIYVDLSSEFSQGGGTTSMIYRVAQVLYTATSLDPKAKVFLSVESQPLDENHPLGGEGLILRQPMTRQDFAQDFPLF